MRNAYSRNTRLKHEWENSFAEDFEEIYYEDFKFSGLRI
jgi:hypothetical protein